jgi:AcrR family transcriptional regulator
MRYPLGQKERTRERVLGKSATLAKQKGFAAVSVDDLMKASGLTGGAFYAHFKSKNALFAELIQRELGHSAEMLSPGASQTEKEWLAELVDSYLTSAHVRSPATGCAIPALGAEIGRSDSKVRRAFEASLSRLQKGWADRLGNSELAWSTICQLVGTIVVARAMESKASVDAVVNANRAQIRQAASNRATSKRRRAAKS